ncbi:nicotinate-nucleotide adenylyltransferase [Andreprevotia chitinilytica]|uniref:nicotinate-nucleotide adenylyltransferase n=1 Tax=Andreprevotia chitinilytica TaxID=396808 RepID=UPI00054E7DFC|nr:nicotinate-nucleotide adenylyltransferase [Andreprevotia chitinilytica]
MTSAIGIYGGTFDPIHYGHIALASMLRDTFALPEVRLIPTGHPPHRPDPPVTPQQRFAWVQQALADETGLIADDREIHRAGYCYTVDTLEALQQAQPDTLLVWLIGGDSFANLPSWHRWRTLLELGHLVVAPRPEHDLAALPVEIAQEFAKRRVSAARQSLARGKISLLPSPLMAVSSTGLREKLARGEDVSALTPVAEAVMHSGLYCPQ